MGSIEIPNWVGPVLTPIVLILSILAVCWYYCYWKPRKERKQKEKDSTNKEEEKNTVSHSAVSRGTGTTKQCVKSSQMKYVDEGISYGCGYECDSYTSYGLYNMDYCALPSSGMSYCVKYECKPKFVYYPNGNAPSRHAKSRGTESRCKGIERTRKCRVKCQRGECIKCPDLPMIVEGDSTLSLCEEKDNKNEQNGPGSLKGEDFECMCNVDDEDVKEIIVESEDKPEAKMDDISDEKSNCCADSGYED